MAFLLSRAFWRSARFAGLLSLLLVLLGVKRCTDERQLPPVVGVPAVRLVSFRPAGAVGDTSTSARPNLGRKALPRSRWHAVPASALFVHPLPRQVSLDVAAQLHKI